MDRPISVLHVDDEPDFADLTGTFLEREDDRFAVETATSADEGLELINDRPPDCVVSDYNMPGMDGIEFLQAVREEHPDLPFILFTGKGSEAVASDAIAAGVTDYLQKGSGSEQYELLANRILNAVETRREAERADRQEQLIRLTEFAGDTGGFELDTETGELLLTDGVRRLIDRSAGADLSLTEAIDLYHPEDREDIRQTIDRARQTGEQTHGTWRLQAQDGDERIVDVTVTPAATDGDTEILRGSIHDITDQHERQQELKSERRFITQALDALDDLFYVLNTDGTLRRWNETALEETGHSESELDGLPAIELFPEDERETVSKSIEATLTDGEARVNADLLTADGQRIPYEFTGGRLTDADGNTTGLVGIGRDLTERRQRERRFRALVEESNDIISIIDADGRFQYQSPSLERILGHDPAETIGERVWEYIHPDDRERVAGVFEKRMATGETPEPIEYRARHADGSWHWMEARGNGQLNDSAVDGYVVNSRDITARKQDEQQLAEREQTLRELHAATRELYPPGDETEIAEFLVGFLSSAFEFPYISVKQFDEAGNCLQPAVKSSVLDETTTPGRVEPGPNPIWSAYEYGVPGMFDLQEHPDIFDSIDPSLEQGLAVPVGDFGVVVVYAQDADSIDGVARDLLDVVAANAESAFERLRAVDTHADIVAALSSEQAKVEELTTITSVLQGLHENLVAKETTDALDESVCTHLTQTDRIDFAWIGRPEGVETNLHPAGWAGQERGYLDEVDIKGGDDSLPAHCVVGDHEQCLLTDIGSHATEADWAKHALTAGFRSVLSVPLVYDDVLYGVLSAYSCEEDAFDQTYRSLVTNAGSLLVSYNTTLANRYEETQREFTMLEFELSDPAYPFNQLAATTDSRIRVDTVVEATDTEMQLLVTVLDGDPETVFDQAQSVTTVTDVNWFGEASDQLSVQVQKPFLASVIGKHDAVLFEAVSDSDGTEFRVKLPGDAHKRPVLESLLSEYHEVSPVAQRQMTNPDVLGAPQVDELLTDRQHEILGAAFHGGYYETPKQIKGKELAANFDISTTAVHNHRQAAHRRIFEAFLDGESEYQS